MALQNHRCTFAIYMSILKPAFNFILLACTTICATQQSCAQNTNLIDVVFIDNDSTSYNFLRDTAIYTEHWDTLAQPKFWSKIMQLPPDSCILNIAKTREILDVMSIEDWDINSDDEKMAYRDTLRLERCLDYDTRIFVTTGKRDYYDFMGVIPTISRGIEVFDSLEVDPWYAQAILLIESPGKINRSGVGAYGSFQLMKTVARKYGLVVNRSIDERENFDRSAYAAASLISKSSIPEAKRILRANGVIPDENALWFKLFVMHIYHAGAGNVGALVRFMEPVNNGNELIRRMWQTEYGRFKNSSQNYTQLALAAFIHLDKLIDNKCEYLHECEIDF